MPTIIGAVRLLLISLNCLLSGGDLVRIDSNGRCIGCWNSSELNIYRSRPFLSLHPSSTDALTITHKSIKINDVTKMRGSTAFAVVSKVIFGQSFIHAYHAIQIWYTGSALADTLIAIAMTYMVNYNASSIILRANNAIRYLAHA